GGTPLRIRRPAPVLQGNVNEMVARLALSGRDTAAIARQTGMARDAVQLVLLRDARTTPAATPVAAPEPAPALDRDAAARTARRDDATVRSLAEARRARTTRAVIEAVRRDPRATGVAERARVAEGRVGTRFNATVG
ncbi:MAG: hypothetical protein MUF21_09320, partial [Gemmatimonadaceae bacterium]|nr:hypothetical protein [Gemmatimonadaceae bacterium]